MGPDCDSQIDATVQIHSKVSETSPNRSLSAWKLAMVMLASCCGRPAKWMFSRELHLVRCELRGLRTRFKASGSQAVDQPDMNSQMLSRPLALYSSFKDRGPGQAFV